MSVSWCMCVKEQLAGVSFPFYHVSPGDCTQAVCKSWWQEPLPTELSH